MNECQCASMRPASTPRPSAAMTLDVSIRVDGDRARDMRSIVLPLTRRTLEGARADAALLPSKMTDVLKKCCALAYRM